MDAGIDSTEMYLKVVFSFAFVVALMLGFSWLLRKLGIASPGMMPGAKRRLKIVEHLALDTRRRLVLVRRDDREHLIVIGGQGGDFLVETDIPAPPEKQPAPQDIPQQEDTAHAG
ncbi:MAG: flagellar biosynthetic protein FliO [Bdellovibrionales bacterium]|jgi:flagellar protein FliO/FliZ|nr:flagellar biosynthetic protein FliO [Bdellovibrionales bacterium]